MKVYLTHTAFCKDTTEIVFHFEKNINFGDFQNGI
jgi:hypothetical protein